MSFFPRGPAVMLAALLASCAHHTDKLFDVESHRAEWAARAPEAPDLAGFAARLTASAPLRAEFNPSDGLDLAEAEIAGLFFNGALRSARAEAGVAAAGAAKAGLWPDPSVNMSVLRILDLAAEPWVIGADAALSIPFTGMLARSKGIAVARSEAEAWRVAAEEWRFLHELRRGWIEWSAFDTEARQVEVHLAELERVLEVVRALGEADEIPRTDARLFEIERASLRIEHHHFSHEAEERLMAIRTMIGFRPDAEIALHPAVQPFAVEGEQGHPHPDESAILQEHPSMRALRAGLDEAVRILEREHRAAWGGVEAGPSFERDDGVNKAGGTLNLTLPLWNRNQRAIAEAEAGVRTAEARWREAVERMTGELAAAEHRLHAAQTDWEMLTGELAPLVERQIEEARALAELGDLNALLLLEALKKSHETKLRMIEAQGEIAGAVADLWALAPPNPLPVPLEETSHEHVD